MTNGAGGSPDRPLHASGIGFVERFAPDTGDVAQCSEIAHERAGGSD